MSSLAGKSMAAIGGSSGIRRQGREAARAPFTIAWQWCHGMRLLPTSANRRPAFTIYARTSEDTTEFSPNGIRVLTFEQ